MRAGILTFHASLNCGSMLQAYALQHVLKSHGIDNEIINFSNQSQQKMYSILYKPSSAKELARCVLNSLFYQILKRERDDFLEFSSKYLRIGKTFYSNSDMMNELEAKYDIFIAGSDQVWNARCKDNDKAYFLNFIHHKPCYAYAVSMGATDINQLSDVEQMDYRNLILHFTAISVREKNAQLWIEQLSGVTPSILPDPTLLLSSEKWEHISLPRLVKEKYVFWYCMNYTKTEREAVKKLAEELKLSVYVIDDREWSRRALFLHGIKRTEKSGPAAFLSMMKNAEYVVTSSFHGTVFASIFEKQFLYMKTATGNSKDDRARCILRQLGLEERLVATDRLTVDNIKETIDYKKVKENIHELQDNANKWIKEGIIGAK